MGTADTGAPQQSEAQDGTNQETTSSEQNSETALSRYEYQPPHKTQEAVREKLDSNDSKQIVAKKTMYGEAVGLILAILASLSNDSTLLFGSIIAIGGIAGAVNGLQSALPEQINPGVNETAVHLLPLYLVATLVGGVLLSIPLGILAVVVAAVSSAAFSIGQIVSSSIIVAGLLMAPVVAINSHDHFVESFFQGWDERFERANNLSNHMREIDTEFEQYDPIYEKVQESNPHLYGTQEEADSAINSAESFLSRLKKWDELSNQYDELYSDGLDLGERFERTDQILSTIEPANPQNYERHIIAEVEPATNAVESANTYISHLKRLGKRCDSLGEWDEKCPYDVKEVDIFFERVAHSDFASGTETIQDLIQRADSLISLLQEWDELANRYEDANTKGVALSKRFDNTNEIRTRLHQYDPKLYEQHGSEELDKAQSGIETCENYVNNLSELSDLLESAEERNEKTDHEIGILFDLIDKIKAVDPAVESSTVEQLTREADQVEDCLDIAKEKATLQERVASKPHHVHQRDRNELLNRISAIDVLSNPDDAQERLNRYRTVVECLEQADSVSTRLPSSVSESLDSELREVIRSDDILDDADYERIQRLLELFSSSEQIADFLDDTHESEEVPDENSYLYEFENMADRYQPKTSSEDGGHAAEPQLPESVNSKNKEESAVEAFSRSTLDPASILQRDDNTSSVSETGKSSDSKKENGSSQSADGDASDGGDIINVNGVSEAVAATLRESGYLTEGHLREASMDDLASLDGLSEQLAMRIKLDVGE